MRRGLSFATLAFALALLLGVGAAAAAGPAIARPDPLSSTVLPGSTFTVDLYLQDVTNAYGADIRMCFDPALLQVQDANTARPGVQIQPLASFMQPGFVIKQEAFNAADPARENCKTSGLVWYAFTQLNPAEPKTGSGPLAQVTFKALKAGVSPLAIEYQKTADRDGIEIPTMHQDGTVKVGGTGPAFRLMLPLVQR